MDRVLVGYVRRAHGTGGAVVVRPLTDAPGSRFIVGARFQTDEASPRGLEIRAVGPHNDGLLVSFSAVTDRTTSESLRGVRLTIDASERRELRGDEFWPEDIIGCDVVDPAGTALGVVTEVVWGAAQERLAVTTGDGERVEVPFVADLVPSLDLDQRRIVVDAPDGLFG